MGTVSFHYKFPKDLCWQKSKYLAQSCLNCAKICTIIEPESMRNTPEPIASAALLNNDESANANVAITITSMLSSK